MPAGLSHKNQAGVRIDRWPAPTEHATLARTCKDTAEGLCPKRRHRLFRVFSGEPPCQQAVEVVGLNE